MDGSTRDLLHSASLVRLHDVARDGRILISSESMQVATEGHLAVGSERAPVSAAAR